MSIEKFEVARAKLAAQKAEYIEAGRVAFKDLCAEVFAQAPGVDAIAWTQYTPYFNDGDACTFSVGDVYFYKRGDELSDDDDEPLDGYTEVCSGCYWRGDKPTLEQKLCKQFNRFVSDNADILESLFEDHCRVVVTREGVEVQEYDHD
jgi:hypothetical protein